MITLVLGRNRSDNLKLALTEFQKLLLLLVVEDLAKFNIKIFGFSEPDKSLIYSSTSLIERTDQTTSIAGQLWIWRELDESSRHLHKLFILPYFTATSLSIIFIFRRRRHYCTAFKLFWFHRASVSFVAEVLEPSPPNCSQTYSDTFIS